MYQGVGDQFGHDQQHPVGFLDLPPAQRARGETAGVHHGVGQAPHHPACPDRPGLHAVVAQQQQRHVVLAAADVAQQFVGHPPGVCRVGRGERGACAVHPLVQGQVGGLHQAVGDQSEHRAGGQRQRGHGELRLGEYAQREPSFDLYLLGGAVGMAYQWGEVPGPDEQCVALLHVQFDIATGGEQIGFHADEQPIGVGDDHVRRVSLHRVCPDRGPHLAHDRRGSGAVPLHVTDDQRHPILGDDDDVVPVAAHLEPTPGGQIAGDGRAPGQFGQAPRQQAALKHRRELLLGVVRVRAFEGLPDQHCGCGQHGPLLGDELVRLIPADQAHADDPTPGGQWHDGQASGTDACEPRF